ncbi:DUF4143 domain-containing protein [Paracoccus liaowanqingii]|uniref:DUF4143 domain-containing protein n=1 Tax=Paracoccus liaowanqingii TaxID=2560053 RepID=UPI0038B2C448
MLAHHRSSRSHGAELARVLGVDGKTVWPYLDLLVVLMLVRRLKPWRANIGKRPVKFPRIYVRDIAFSKLFWGGKHWRTFWCILSPAQAGRGWLSILRMPQSLRARRRSFSAVGQGPRWIWC